MCSPQTSVAIHGCRKALRSKDSNTPLRCLPLNTRRVAPHQRVHTKFAIPLRWPRTPQPWPEDHQKVEALALAKILGTQPRCPKVLQDICDREAAWYRRTLKH